MASGKSAAGWFFACRLLGSVEARLVFSLAYWPGKRVSGLIG